MEKEQKQEKSLLKLIKDPGLSYQYANVIVRVVNEKIKTEKLNLR